MRIARILAGVFFFAGCSSELPHEAAFDPNAPLEKQAKASLSGTIQLDGESDSSQVTVDLQNEARTYNVDTAADGGMSLTGIVPGRYTLSLRTRYFQAVTEPLTVALGESVKLGTRILVPLRGRVLGLATSERLQGSNMVPSGGVGLSLKKTSSIRVAVASAPAFRTAAVAAATGPTLRTVSGIDGSYEFGEVPAGGYRLYASTPETGERVVGDVTVTGEGDVQIEPIVLRPLTGYFEILGTANGVQSRTHTNVPAVNLKLEQSNATQVKVAASTDGTADTCNLAAATPEALPGNMLRPFTFTSEGKKLVCVSYLDADGKETAPLYGSIVYDATAPGPVSVTPVVAGGYSKEYSRLVNIAAVDTLSGVVSVALSPTTDFTAVVPIPYQPTLLVTYGAAGPQTTYFRVYDAAGNYNAVPVGLSVVVDPVAPLVVPASTELRTQAGTPVAATIHDPKLVLVSSVTDDSPLEMQLTVDGRMGAWEPYSASRLLELNLPVNPDGESRTISAQVRDAAGNLSTLLPPTVLSLDTIAPAGSIDIAAAAVTVATVQVQALSSDAIEVELAFDPGFVTSLGRFAPGTISVLLPAGDGSKSIYGRFFDAAGNASALGGDTVVLDTTPPQILSFTLAVTGPTRFNPIDVHYGAAGAAELRITEGGACGGVREPVGGGVRTFTLSASEGAKTVRLQFFDAAGNAGDCVARSLYYDPNPPVVGGLQINYGQAATSSNIVTISFVGVSGATRVILGESADFAGSDWSSYAAAKTFTLSAGNGVKTLYAKVADDAGHVVALPQQTITLDTTPPTNPSIFAAADVTTQSSVLLTLSAGLVAEMMLSQDDPTFASSAWEPYTGSKVFSLSGTDGTKTLYAKFRKATLVETAVVSDSVILDRTAPVLPSVRINNGASVVTSKIVTLNLSAVDAASGLATYKVNTTNDFSSPSYNLFQASDVYTLSDNDGLKIVWVTIGDRAGLYAQPVSTTVLLDTTPPAAGSFAVTRIDGTPLGAGDTIADTRVLLTSTVTDLSGLEMQVTANGSFVGVAWVPYEPNKVVDLTNGTPSISARVRDGAGLITNLITAFDLTIDATAPLVTFARSSAALTNDLTVAFTLSSNETSMAQVSEDPGFGGAVWFSTANASRTLTPGDGLRTLFARARDAAGNMSATQQITVQIDATPPSGESILINGGAAYTQVAGVTLTLGGLGASEMQISGNGAFAGAAWVPFTTSYAHTITGAQGANTIHMRLRDAAGNVGAAVSSATIFDSQAPTGAAIAIVEQPATRESRISLTLAAAGATELMLADDASFAGRPWQPVAASIQWTLPPGDGTKSVFVKYRDAAGNESAPAGATTILDTTPPVAGSLMLNGGSTVTGSTVIGYSIAATDALSEPLAMQVSGEPGFGGATWFAYGASGVHSIAPGDGVRSLYVRFRDAVGNVSLAASGSFVLDQTGPQLASFIANGGRVFGGTSIAVEFQVGNWNAGDTVQVATAANFSGATVYPANAGINTGSFVFAAPDGPKIVYARARDTLGNVGPAWSSAITRDTVPPAVSGPKAVVLSGDDNFTTTRFVDLDLNVSGASEMLLWNAGELLYATWEPFAASTAWALPFGDGVHTVHARFRDAAYNVIQPYSDMITLDTEAPTSPFVSINGGAQYATAVSVTLALSAVGATRMQLSGDGVFDTEPYLGYAVSDTWVFPAGEGQKTVYARFCDAAGNCSQIVSAAVLLDQTPPTGAIAINQGAARTASATVALNLSALDSGSGLQGIRLANSLAALATTDVVPFEATKLWTLAAPTGAGIQSSKTVWMNVVDRAGLSSASLSDGIIFDTLNPTGSIGLAAAVTRDTLVGVNLTFVADVTHMKLSTGNSCAGGNWVEASTQTAFNLPGVDGVHNVSVRFRDSVLNESTCYSAGITLDRVGPLVSSFTLTGSGTPQAGYSGSTVVTANFGTAEACVRAEFAEDVGFGVIAKTVVSCSGSTAYTFSNPADGFKTLYLRFVDGLGNAGPVADQMIVVDSSTPTVGAAGGFTVAQGFYVKAAGITLQMQAVNATRMRVAQSATCTGGLETYAATRPHTLTGGEGTKTLAVRFEDDAGNATACYTRPVTLDSTISTTWTVGLTGADGRTVNTSSQVLTIALTGLNLSDVFEMRTSNLANFADAQWVAVQTSYAWAVPCCDGAKTVYVEVRDRAGNSSLKTASITVDMTPPDSPVIQIADIDGDSFPVTAATIELMWNLPAGSSTFELQRQIVGEDVDFLVLAAALPGTQSTYTDTFAENGRQRRYRIRGVDAVGNTSAWSGIAEDTPFSDGGNLFWTMGTEQQIRYAFPPKPGAYQVQATYSYEQADGTLISDVVAAGSAEFSMPWPTATLWNERLTVRTANQNNSLVYESTYDLGRNIKEIATTGGDTGIEPVLRVDRFGRAHAIFFEGWDSIIYYGVRENGVWSIEPVTPRGDLINWAYDYPDYSLAVDANGNPFIAAFYSSAATKEVHLYTKSGSTWSSQTISATGRTFGYNYSDMLLDRNGKLHLFFADVIGTNYNLRYITNASGSWVGSDLWNTGGTGTLRDVRVTQDTAGKLHITFQNWSVGACCPSPSTLYYGTNKLGAWAISAALTAAYDVGWLPSISVSNSGANIYISHSDGTNYDTLLTSKIGAAAWSTQIIDAVYKPSERTEVYVDDLGKVHLVAHDSDEVFYYTNTTGVFTKTLLMQDVNLWMAQMWATFDRSGRVHMAFWDTTARGMLYMRYSTPALLQFDMPETACGVLGNEAVQFGSDGILHAIDECSGLRHYSGIDPFWKENGSFDITNANNDMVLRLDGNNMEHVVARRSLDNRLIYRKQTGAGTYSTTVLAANAGTATIGLALTSAGLPRVVYKDGVTNVLYLREYNGVSWFLRTVATDGADTTFEPSIAVDAAGNSWIVYLVDLADGSNQLRLVEVTAAGVVQPATTLYAPPNDPLLQADDLWLWDAQIRFDSQGNKHILFSQSSNSNEIMHLSDETGVWNLTRVRGGLFTLHRMSFVIDPWDNLRIGYTGETYTDIYLESRFGGQWGRVRISDESQPNLSLGIDPFTGDAQMIGDASGGRIYRNGAGTIRARQTGMVQAY